MKKVRRQRDPELQAIFDELRKTREAYERGEVDEEGRPTAFGTLLMGSKPVETKEEED